MEIHTYRARSLQEALMLVRHDLGPEASVLQTREVAGRLFGLLGKPCIEVQASRDARVIRRLPDTVGAAAMSGAISAATLPVESAGLNDDHDSTASFDLTEDEEALQGATPAMHFDHSVAARTDTAHGDDPYADQLHDDPANVRSYAAASQAIGASVMRRRQPVRTPEPGSPVNHLSTAMFEVFTEMLDADVDPESARTMLQQVAAVCMPEHLDDPWLIKGRLSQLIQQQVSVSGAIELPRGGRQVVALIGPTGVGKTTTLAKLAAGFHFDQGCEVGFITLDTFRLGAVDQLQKYADLLGAACEVVSSTDQMLPALERLDHCQLILIDTAGRSPRDHSQLGALGDFLRVAEPTQVHLVLSAASSQSHAAMALEQFAALQPTHLLLTKLDESPCLGGWYRMLSSGTWPLSYITTGQHVPDDIIVANRRRVASLILGQTNPSTWK